MSIFVLEAIDDIDHRCPDSREKSRQCSGDLLDQGL